MEGVVLKKFCKVKELIGKGKVDLNKKGKEKRWIRKNIKGIYLLRILVVLEFEVFNVDGKILSFGIVGKLLKVMLFLSDWGRIWVRVIKFFLLIILRFKEESEFKWLWIKYIFKVI